jgi:hypothetical protein
MVQEETIRTVEGWIAKYEEAIVQCERQLLRQQESAKLEADMRAAMDVALVKDSTPRRIFERMIREASGWVMVSPTGYAGPTDLQRLGLRLVILRKVAAELAPEAVRQALVTKRQNHIGAGERGDAIALVYRLMKRATSELLVIDQYADDAVFRLFASLDDSVNIRLLGTKPRARSAVKTIAEGHQRSGMKLEVRLAETVHDRYLVIDGTEVWSLGASINQLGAKAHDIMEITEEDERKKGIAEFEAAWRAGAPL